MDKVGIFFFRPSLGGGTTTFTAHLYKAFESIGVRPLIYKVRPRGEINYRPFGKYDNVKYRNITIDDAIRYIRKFPTVMSAPAADKYLVEPGLIQRFMKLGMRIVLHDPNEFSIYNHLNVIENRKKLKVAKLPTRPICIRPTIQKFYPDAVWIPHPYMRSMDNHTARMMGTRIHTAISVARIASVKRPRIILDANRLLPTRLRCKLLGAEYRMYTLNLQKKYSDVFKQSGKTFQFPMTFEAPVDLCAQSILNIDMTYFPDDGGGTQYSQMEAMDAGCVNVMHDDWLRYDGELVKRKNVWTVNGADELARFVKLVDKNSMDDELHRIRENSFKLLRSHAPKTVGELYWKELNK